MLQLLHLTPQLAPVLDFPMIQRVQMPGVRAAPNLDGVLPTEAHLKRRLITGVENTAFGLTLVQTKRTDKPKQAQCWV